MPESSPPLSTPPELPPAPFDRVNDFPDKLSPMLVKELRQGLRTNTFVTLFLTLQGVLLLVLLVTGSFAASRMGVSGTAGEVLSRVLFCIYALGLLVVQPLRGISAVATEIKQNTIDLMVLTRLSATRIVWGKWTSIVSQSALIFLALLPYLILRYFFGGMQLFAELTLMLYLFALSGALTAFTVGISATGSVLIRGLVVIGGSSFLMIYILFGFTAQFPSYVNFLNFTRGADSAAALGALGVIVYACYFFLELGATAISPAAENRATRKRLVGMTVLVISGLILHLVYPPAALGVSLFIIALISLDLFTEQAHFPPIVCRPFVRRGPLARLSGRLLYPGWPTGVIFFTLLAGLTFAFLALTNSPARQFTTALLAFGTILFPAVLIQLFARQSGNRFTIYLTIMVICSALTLILSALYGAVGDKLFLWIFSFVPMVLLPVVDDLTSPSDARLLLTVSLVTTGLYLIIVLAGAIPAVAKISKLEAEADSGGDH